MLPDLGLLAIALLGLAGLAVLALALCVAGGLRLARSLAERVPVRPDGAPLPMRRPAPKERATSGRMGTAR
ncbi:hypothetical protein [Spirillospora sp. NPDC029432]|uniref:hypothetical protein n=1 Tax=Spirillospora sp. NPDC029432 TaxID=3154599 RepID=UPI00345531F4